MLLRTHQYSSSSQYALTCVSTDHVKWCVFQVLLKWVNDVLEERRIRVRDIVEDLYDGQVLSELMGKYNNSSIHIARYGYILSEQLTGQKFTTMGVTQSAIMQRNKLNTLLNKVDKLLGYSSDSPGKRWSIDS